MGLPSHHLPSFSIALVNYKTLELTKHCLTLLKKHLDAGDLNASSVEVWVVDNHSQDDSLDYLRSLDWIHLIERQPTHKEEGFVAHGQGLDLILASVKTDYMFLMHTDTFVYDASIFFKCLQYCKQDHQVAAVGCLHQVNRGYVRMAWRTTVGFLKYYSRHIKRQLGMQTREPKPYIEPYIKSFFALWNVKLMKQMGWTFLMSNRIPGYALQDVMSDQGWTIKHLSPHFLFKFLDHAEAGTVGLVSGYSAGNRRVKRKQSILKKLGSES